MEEMKGYSANNKVRVNRHVNKFISSEMLGFLVLLAVVFIFFSLVTKDHSFARAQNITNMMTDAVIPGIFALGMGIIITGGGFDLSLGHIGSMAILVTAYLMNPGIGMYPIPAILVGVVVAALVGCFSGTIVAHFGISSFIVTLGVQFLIIGIRQIITGGRSVYIGDEAFKSMASNTYGVPNLVVILAVVGIFTYVLMEKTAYGRKVHFIGENIEASKYKGIDIRKYTLSIFVLGAALSAVAAMLFGARAGAVQINSVDSKLLDAITIAIFSKVLFHRFKTSGIILVSLLIVMIGTGMSMLGIRTEWIDFVKGGILLISIFLAKYELIADRIKTKKLKGVS